MCLAALSRGGPSLPQVLWVRGAAAAPGLGGSGVRHWIQAPPPLGRKEPRNWGRRRGYGKRRKRKGSREERAGGGGGTATAGSKRPSSGTAAKPGPALRGPSGLWGVTSQLTAKLEMKNTGSHNLQTPTHPEKEQWPQGPTSLPKGP